MDSFWKMTGPAYFRAIRPKLCGNCNFPQNFHNRKLGESTGFFALSASDFGCYYHFQKSEVHSQNSFRHLRWIVLWLHNASSWMFARVLNTPLILTTIHIQISNGIMLSYFFTIELNRFFNLERAFLLLSGGLYPHFSDKKMFLCILFQYIV